MSKNCIFQTDSSWVTQTGAISVRILLLLHLMVIVTIVHSAVSDPCEHSVTTRKATAVETKFSQYRSGRRQSHTVYAIPRLHLELWPDIHIKYSFL